MKSICPKCGDLRSKIYESRVTETARRRRHMCSGCGHKYTSYAPKEQKQ